MGQTFAAPEVEGGPPGKLLLFVAPRESWTMLDDWGDTLGLKGSGSHSVRFEQAFIPDRFVLEDTWMVDTNVAGGTPGVRIHGNPMYAGRTLAFFEGELAAIMIGAAKGALDEYEEILRTRKTQRPPIVTRVEDPDYQRWYGLAVGKVSAAEAALLQVAEQWHEACRRSVEDGIPFTREEDLRLNMVAREALTLAWEAMQGEIYRTAGSSAARAGQRIERIFRDMAIGWGHFGTIVRDWTAREWAREHFGLVERGPAARPPAPDRPAMSGSPPYSTTRAGVLRLPDGNRGVGSARGRGAPRDPDRGPAGGRDHADAGPRRGARARVLPLRGPAADAAHVPDDLAANTVEVDAPGFDPERLQRSFYTSSSCGVCGKGALEAVAVEAARVDSRLTVPLAVVESLPGRLREEQAAFAATGGLHATGLFTADGELVCLREDVGRHNALDKTIGWAFLDGRLPLSDHVLCVSGRLSFELVQKAAVAGCPVMVAVGAPSSLAVELAADRGITLCGFVRDGRANVYTEPWRIVPV